MSVCGYNYRLQWLCGRDVYSGINARFCAYCAHSMGIDKYRCIPGPEIIVLEGTSKGGKLQGRESWRRAIADTSKGGDGQKSQKLVERTREWHQCYF